MLKQVTISTNGGVVLQDFLALEAYQPDALFTSVGADASQSITFVVAGTAWTQLRRELIKLSSRRIPIAGTTNTMPALTYTVSDYPGGRPRLALVSGTVGVGAGDSATQTMTLYGENLIAGVAASATVYTQTALPTYALPGTRSFSLPQAVLSVTALAKGPIGNKIAFKISAASGAGSVTTTYTQDGEMLITVVPAAGSSDSTSIAAQINGDAVASLFVVAVALVASAPMGPTGAGSVGVGASGAGGVPVVQLEGGDGAGIAVLDVPVTAGSLANRLRLTAVASGNQANMVTLTINASAGSNSVSVSGNDITVNRTAATAIGTLVTAINANASARALVVASSVGSGNLGTTAKTYLYGGSAETPVVKVGGAAASVTSHSDTQMALSFTKAALVTAGATAAEQAEITVGMNYGLLTAQVVVISTP